MNREKVIVFGGSGFLGSHVSDCLSDEGYSVTIFDSEPSPYLREDQTMVTGDILDEICVREAVESHEIVYNFSGISSIDACAEVPLTAVKNNILGNTILLEQCRLQSVRRFVYASSVYVYSKHGSFYKITKQACENLVQEYQEKFGLDFTILRYGSLYGPRAQNWNGVQRYLTQAIQNGRIDYPGTGEEKREYIHVADAAKLTVDILSDNFRNKHVTITGNDPLSSKELMQMISEILNKNVNICFTNKKNFHHYTITPYSFTPPTGVKLRPNPSVDMGEGILRQIEAIYQEVKH